MSDFHIDIIRLIRASPELRKFIAEAALDPGIELAELIPLAVNQALNFLITANDQQFERRLNDPNSEAIRAPLLQAKGFRQANGIEGTGWGAHTHTQGLQETIALSSGRITRNAKSSSPKLDLAHFETLTQKISTEIRSFFAGRSTEEVAASLRLSVQHLERYQDANSNILPAPYLHSLLRPKTEAQGDPSLRVQTRLLGAIDQFTTQEKAIDLPRAILSQCPPESSIVWPDPADRSEVYDGADENDDPVIRGLLPQYVKECIQSVKIFMERELSEQPAPSGFCPKSNEDLLRLLPESYSIRIYPSSIPAPFVGATICENFELNDSPRRFTIAINAAERLTALERLHVVAHEIGHALLHSKIRNRATGDPDRQRFDHFYSELEANVFSLSILIPDSELEKLDFQGCLTVERLIQKHEMAAPGLSLSSDFANDRINIYRLERGQNAGTEWKILRRANCT